MSRLPDVQRTKDKRGISIDRVGVEKIKFPLYIGTKEGEKVLVYANINLYGSLKHHVRGTNMSRFLEILMEWKYRELTAVTLGELLTEMRDHLGKRDVEDVYAEIEFDYFLPKTSPVSRKAGVMHHKCTFIGRLKKQYEFKLQVKVLTTSNCPCSREISDKGSHGQRSFATVTVTPRRNQFIWLEDLIKLIENAGSCEVYPLLKRVDEKYVTEKAYDNAKFVEDAGRDIGKALQKSSAISKFKIKVVNEESIHPHDAVAYIARKLVGKIWRPDTKGLST